MVRVPQLIYEPVALVLQASAGRLAAAALSVLHIPVVRDGMMLEIAHHRQLTVLEAGTGVRCLYSLVFVTIVYAYVFGRNKWKRCALPVALIPIIVVASAAVTVLAVILSEWKPALEFGSNKGFEAAATSLLAVTILIALHGAVSRINPNARTPV
jgi:exosortase/archaeosortase family protein